MFAVCDATDFSLFQSGGGVRQVRAEDFSLGQDQRAEGRERGVVLGGGATTLHQLGGLGSAVSSPAWFGVEPRPLKGFPLFSALRMASLEVR